jgi:hypothetical protein
VPHDIPPWNAAHHRSTAGTIIVTGMDCRNSPCIWYGDFLSHDFQVFEPDVEASDLPIETTTGTQLPARYESLNGTVYLADAWVGPAVWVGLGTAYLGGVLVWLLIRFSRWLRLRRGSPIGGST